MHPDLPQHRLMVLLLPPVTLVPHVLGVLTLLTVTWLRLFLQFDHSQHVQVQMSTQAGRLSKATQTRHLNAVAQPDD